MRLRTPKFHDHCEHGADEYVGTWRWFATRHGPTYVDVYVFVDSIMGAEVCLRWSSEGSDYSSLPLWTLANYQDRLPPETLWAIGKWIGEHMKGWTCSLCGAGLFHSLDDLGAHEASHPVRDA